MFFKNAKNILCQIHDANAVADVNDDDNSPKRMRRTKFSGILRKKEIT